MSGHTVRWRDALDLPALILKGLCFGLLAFFVASIYFPPSLQQQKKGQRGAAVTQIGSFKSALQLYMLDNGGRPPATLQGLDALVTKPRFGPVPKRWRKYLTDFYSVPKDPWGNDYVHSTPGPSGEAFLIRSYGADGKPGGEGEDADLDST